MLDRHQYTNWASHFLEICKAWSGTWVVRELFWGGRGERGVGEGGAVIKPPCLCLVLFNSLCTNWICSETPPSAWCGQLPPEHLNPGVSGSASQGHVLIPCQAALSEKESLCLERRFYYVNTADSSATEKNATDIIYCKYSVVFSFSNWVSEVGPQESLLNYSFWGLDTQRRKGGCVCGTLLGMGSWTSSSSHNVLSSFIPFVPLVLWMQTVVEKTCSILSFSKILIVFSSCIHNNCTW